MSACPGCGLHWADVDVVAIPAALGDLAGRYHQVLGSAPSAALRRRLDSVTWSALEYACHVRDVLLVQRDRTFIALVDDTPSFAKMNRDERVALGRYAEQPVDRLLSQLDVAFELAASVFTDRTVDQWNRPLIYNYPGPERHTLAWMARHTVHEAEHHLVDITRSLA
jgi:hypothetical protein